MGISSDGAHVGVCRTQRREFFEFFACSYNSIIQTYSSHAFPLPKCLHLPWATFVAVFRDPFFSSHWHRHVPHLPSFSIYGSISNLCDKMISLSYCLLDLVFKCPLGHCLSLRRVLFLSTRCYFLAPVSFLMDLTSCLFFFLPKSKLTFFPAGFRGSSEGH